MNDEQVTEEELAEDRRMVATFRAAGLSEYDSCMLAANINVARRLAA